MIFKNCRIERNDLLLAHRKHSFYLKKLLDLIENPTSNHIGILTLRHETSSHAVIIKYIRNSSGNLGSLKTVQFIGPKFY